METGDKAIVVEEVEVVVVEAMEGVAEEGGAMPIDGVAYHVTTVENSVTLS